MNKPLPQKILNFLKRRLIDSPRGMGRPTDKRAFDEEYESGSWGHFFDYNELPRQLVLAGSIRHFHPEGHVLDIGCGNGKLAELCEAYHFPRYVGIDLSSVGIQQARELNLAGTEFIEANFENWLPSEKYDAISFNECLSYSKDPRAIMERFYPYLRPGGHAFVSVHRYGNYAALWKRIENISKVIAATTVMDDQNHSWDIKVLQPAD